MKCKDCIKWLFKTEAKNGTYGKCALTKKWTNEKYWCDKSKK